MDFIEAFGKATKRNSCWDETYLNVYHLQPPYKYVAWVDLLGASNVMSLSLYKASNFVGKIHDAALKAHIKYPAVNLYPITDGFYIVSDDYQVLIDFTKRVFRSVAYEFDTEPEDHKKFVIRGAISYGPFIDSQQMTFQPDIQDNPANEIYLNNVILGPSIALAYAAESKAPPFGILIDDTVIVFGSQSSGSRLHKWWDLKNPKQNNWAKTFGQKVIDYFEWEMKHKSDCHYPIDKHEKYITLTKEYFEL